MSESDGMDDVLDGGLRQSLMIASRIAETLARRRQESQRQQEHQDAQTAHEAQTRLAAERSAAHAALAPVEKDQWWDKAQPSDIATAHAVAEGWKDHDPAALAASEKIRQEILTRYGIDTHDVGADFAYLESGIQTITNAGQVPVQSQDDHKSQLTQASEWAAAHQPKFFADWKQRHGFADTVADAIKDETKLIEHWQSATGGQEETRKAVVEHEKSMQLIAAARVEELRAQAAKLAPEMERHQVPVEYLANPELAQALQTAHTAKTPTAVLAADALVKERMFLIGKDGINGLDMDQLRKETTANVNGAGDSHFGDPEFVKAAKEMHEAKLLAEGGFKGSERRPVEQRYERAEKELFARMEGVGREIENRVTGNDSSRLKDQGLKAESTSAADYGSAEHHGKFAESLQETGANETQIRGRLAAARSEGTHPSAAVTMGKGAAKARKSRAGAAVGSERGKNGRGFVL
ncbi:hypothetical protein QK290_13430 [Pseudarthrobacter sp. AL07]|uniref:hypothetical protein n=1 Tax=unclassified Pseudarthrobacter TaxID=2647000 RepID=UPI00249A8C3B|nr:MULTISPECIES: hypothetical protein [unclassified Pseudarthrobacter]MDI3195417.1 hypothetical protein [Pseudarthrobacter sp. AL20]MDI3209483.1 hypothetical protein [Pseudarthrobacter sp. AL07]